jgi:NADH-quinone oxidoreductase subunit J
MERIIFYILAAAIIVFSLFSVTSTRILRAAVYLFLVLVSIAGVYFMLGYHFLGAVQLTVYAGGIVVLIIFSILLTEQIDSRMPAPGLGRMIMSAAVALIGAGLSIFAITGHTFKTTSEVTNLGTVENVGERLLSYGEAGYVLPFEVISILLLAAMIGAIVIAKRPKESEKGVE